MYQFDRRASARLILQSVNYDFNSDRYIEERDPKEEDFFTQLLFSCKINPQTVLYLGYSDDYYASRAYAMKRGNRALFATIG